MRTRVEGVTERILVCAKSEFLENGFQGASIREIAKKAETSPRAIYTRFSDKEDLFFAIVRPAAQEFRQIVENAYNDNALEKHPQQYDFSTEQGFIDLMNFIYDNFDEFKLLTTCPVGTEYDDFISGIVDMDMKHESYWEIRKKETLSGFNLILQRMLSKNFFTSLFEPVINDLSREDARLYIEKFYKFYMRGVEVLM
ncbi:MAG: TetR/AcrR family transcriptional regulator [Lachnospiraceae bacterium]